MSVKSMRFLLRIDNTISLTYVVYTCYPYIMYKNSIYKLSEYLT